MSSIPAAADAPVEGVAEPRPVSGRWSLPVGVTAAYGGLTVLLGVLVLVWPDATLLVAVALFAAHLFLHGVAQVAQAVRSTEGGRAVAAVGGGLSLLVAFLVLRRPLQTLAVVAILLGAWWVVEGVLDVVAAIGARDPGWPLAVLGGAISVLAGGYVLLRPAVSLVVLVWLMGLWMIAYGVAAVVRALRARRETD